MLNESRFSPDYFDTKFMFSILFYLKISYIEKRNFDKFRFNSKIPDAFILEYKSGCSPLVRVLCGSGYI